MHTPTFRSGIILVALCSVIAPPALAQTPSPAPPNGGTVRWNNGLHLESSDGQAVFQLGTLLQFDGRFAPGDPPPITDSFLIRRGRILLQARLPRVDVYLVPEFSGSVLNLLDAFVETRLSSTLQVRAGKFKSPLGLEHLYADSALPFAERSLASNLSPNRDLGVAILGDAWSGRLRYAGAVLNGVPDAASADVDTNRDKDLAGRVTLDLGSLEFALAGSRGEAAGTLAGYRSMAQQTFFSYSQGVAADGARRRVTPSVAFYRGQVGAFGEYFRNTHRVTVGGTSRDLTHAAWNATVIVVLTGEPVSERAATPRAPFDPAQGHWGALQLAVRASAVSIDDRAFDPGWAATGASRRARAVGAGVVWYHSAQARHVLSFERTMFDTPDGVREPEHAVVYRFQVNLAPRF